MRASPREGIAPRSNENKERNMIKPLKNIHPRPCAFLEYVEESSQAATASRFFAEEFQAAGRRAGYRSSQSDRDDRAIWPLSVDDADVAAEDCNGDVDLVADTDVVSYMFAGGALGAMFSDLVGRGVLASHCNRSRNYVTGLP